MTKNKTEKQKRNYSPILSILIMILIVMLASFVLTLLGFEAQKTTIVNNKLETSLITIKNIISLDGIRFIFGNAITNFQILEPLGFLLVALITVTFMDYSGIIKPIAKPFRKLKSFVLTFIVLIISFIFSSIGDYSYLILMPLVALIYKEIGKNPVTGIITVFLGLTLGYGTGFIFDYNDYLLGMMTEQAAKIDIDKNYKYHLVSNLYIMISTTIILSTMLTYLIEKRINPKLPKIIKKEEIEIIDQEVQATNNKKGFLISSLVFTLLMIILIYLIIPGLPYSGVLLDASASNYLSKLFSANSSFNEGLPYILMFIMIITSLIYGKLSKNISEGKEFSSHLSTNLNGVGYTLILMFFAAQLIAIINWTNIGEVVAAKLINFMASLEFSGILLILTFFIVTVLISIFIPSTITKWILMSPLIVPLFMRSNLTPEFTQFIFQAADGVGKVITPLFIYFIIMLGFVQNYVENQKISIFRVYRILMPSILAIAGILILIVIGWFIIGLPLGPTSYPAL